MTGTKTADTRCIDVLTAERGWECDGKCEVECNEGVSAVLDDARQRNNRTKCTLKNNHAVILAVRRSPTNNLIRFMQRDTDKFEANLRTMRGGE